MIALIEVTHSYIITKGVVYNEESSSSSTCYLHSIICCLYGVCGRMYGDTWRSLMAGTHNHDWTLCYYYEMLICVTTCVVSYHWICNISVLKIYTNRDTHKTFATTTAPTSMMVDFR
jgi:hypothetical protein